MAKKPPRYAWDSSAFLSWLNEETHVSINHVRAVIKEIEDEEAILITSVLAHSEILESKNTKKNYELFKGFLKRSNIIVVDVDQAIAEKASLIRDKAINEKKERILGAEDAIFVATAILYEADALHATDAHFLHLNGSSTVDKLEITHPKTRTGSTAFA